MFNSEFYDRQLLHIIPFQKLSFTNVLTLNMKHKNYEANLFLKILYFKSNGSLNIPRYIRELIDRVLKLTIEGIVEKNRIF